MRKEIFMFPPLPKNDPLPSDPHDNIPQERFYKVRSDLRGRIAIRRNRWMLINFAKFVVLEFLNRADYDVENIVDEWMKSHADTR